ncbi:NAD-dependent epimerase/dehydratase family protein [Paenibacillus andongensis]|uniref:NAD-dependent epimerase/dehydratase family protein n=1 Tax=Paenibacillus andongensis TaxID=2975482 RepID=UPI0021BAF2B6|nr:NAD-dependent epimerase/dehydratase family protein [Paenibacillus andongensis]
MKAVVTGGAGFIGSHLVEELLAEQFEVHIIDNLISGKQKHVNPQAIFHLADISSEQIKPLIVDIRPDVVFHLAAQADVQRSIQNPGYDAMVNLVGTIYLLEACRDAAVSKFIFASTSAVYGNLQKEQIVETDPTSPISYYGISKYSAESYIRVFQQLYGLPYTILRYGNVYGPRQTPKGEGGVVAVFMERIQQGAPLTIHGDGEQTRDFVYVKDVVRANVAAMKRGEQEIIHVSTANRTSINDLARLLTQFHGTDLPIIHSLAREGDIKHSNLNNQKGLECLGWQAKYEIRAGLEETYHSYMNESIRDVKET